MNIGGWIVMVMSVGSVLALTAYCAFKLLTLPVTDASEHLKAPLIIDTHDLEGDD